MGVNNRQRRAAKVRQRAKERARRGSSPGPRSGWFDAGRDLRAQVREAVGTALDHPKLLDAAVQELVELKDQATVDAELEVGLLRAMHWGWANGWQPAEIIRQAKRADARAGRLVLVGVIADHAGRHPSTLHPRWLQQIEALGSPRGVPSSGWLTAFSRREAAGRADGLTVALVALRALGWMRAMRVIVPPPGSAGARVREAGTAGGDDPVLVRVRALLAKAESSPYEAEAEAFTAKAQELMARHSIDTAMVWAVSARDEQPIFTRIPVDDPYADLKSLLLDRVAAHARCRVVWDGTHGLATVVGFTSDVAATDLLFTSLLVQAHTALRAEAAAAGPGGRRRSRSFRSSFLMSFTQRIDQRLGEITAAVEREAAVGSSALLPALVSRGDAVGAATEELFGDGLTRVAIRGGRDIAGWASGVQAANSAQLNFGDLESGRPTADLADGPVGQLPLAATG